MASSATCPYCRCSLLPPEQQQQQQQQQQQPQAREMRIAQLNGSTTIAVIVDPQAADPVHELPEAATQIVIEGRRPSSRESAAAGTGDHGSEPEGAAAAAAAERSAAMSPPGALND